MAISTGGGEGTSMSEINTTPLVDVMLVLLIIFLIAIPVALQEVEKLTIPIEPSEESENKVENVLLSVTATDANGRSPYEAGYEGANPNGECRVYWNVTPMASKELYDRAFSRLDAIVKSKGGSENMKEEDVPQVHIRSDINTPWQCVGATIYQVQLAGYPKVAFISNPVDPGI